MGWLRSVGSIKLWVSFAEYCLFYRALLQNRPMILSILLTNATSYLDSVTLCLLQCVLQNLLQCLKCNSSVCFSSVCVAMRVVQYLDSVTRKIPSLALEGFSVWLVLQHVLQRWGLCRSLCYSTVRGTCSSVAMRVAVCVAVLSGLQTRNSRSRACKSRRVVNVAACVAVLCCGWCYSKGAGYVLQCCSVRCSARVAVPSESRPKSPRCRVWTSLCVLVFCPPCTHCVLIDILKRQVHTHFILEIEKRADFLRISTLWQ